MGAREGSVSRGGGKEGSAKRELVQVKGFVRIFSHIMLDAKKKRLSRYDTDWNLLTVSVERRRKEEKRKKEEKIKEGIGINILHCR
jgi:hypothetical protein